MLEQKYLEKLGEVRRERDLLSEMYEQLQSDLLKTTSSLSLMPIHGGDDPHKIEVVQDKIDDCLEELEAKRMDYTELYEEINSVINKVPNATHRRLLKYRYILGLKWKDVAASIGISCAYVKAIHREALCAVNILKNTLVLTSYKKVYRVDCNESEKDVS